MESLVIDEVLLRECGLKASAVAWRRRKLHLVQSCAREPRFPAIAQRTRHVWSDDCCTIERDGGQHVGACIRSRVDVQLRQTLVCFSVRSYLPFSTKAHVTTTLPAGAQVHSEAKLAVNPIVTYLAMGYRF